MHQKIIIKYILKYLLKLDIIKEILFGENFVYFAQLLV